MIYKHAPMKLLGACFAMLTMATLPQASASLGDWPAGVDDCLKISNKKMTSSYFDELKGKCYISGIYQLSTPDRSGYQLVRKHGRKVFRDEEQVEFIKSLGFAYDQGRQENKYGDIEAHGLTEAIRSTSNTKKHPEEKWIHEPVYDRLYPISTEKALVRLFDGSWRIATARSNTYDPIPFPTQGIVWKAKRLHQSADAHWQIFNFSKIRDVGNGAEELRLIRPDMTLGAVLTNVAVNEPDNIIFSGDEVFVKHRDPSTGAITLAAYQIEDLYKQDTTLKPPATSTPSVTLYFGTGGCPPAGCDTKTLRSSGNFAVLGDLPADSAIHENAEDKRLFWPMLENGTQLPKPDHVLGLVPFRFFVGEGNTKPTYNSGMIAVLEYEPGAGYDYMVVGGPGDQADPHVASPAVEQLNDTAYLLDELKIYEQVYKYAQEFTLVFQTSDWGDWYAINSDTLTYGGPGFSKMPALQEAGFSIPQNMNFGSLKPSSTPADAIEQALSIRARKAEFEAEQKRREESEVLTAIAMVKYASGDDILSDTYNCQSIRSAARSLRLDDLATQEWLSLYERFPSAACRNIPRGTHQATKALVQSQEPDYDAPDPFDMDAAMREFTRQNDERIKNIRNERCTMNPDGKTKTCVSGR